MARKSKAEAEMDTLRDNIKQKLNEGKTLAGIFQIFPFFVALEQVVAAFLFKDHPYGELMAETSAHTVFQAMKDANCSDDKILRSALAAGHPFARVYHFFVKSLGRSAREVAVMCFSIEMSLVEVIKGFLSVGMTGKQLLKTLWEGKDIKPTQELIEGLLGAGYGVDGIVQLFWSEFSVPEDNNGYIHWPMCNTLYERLREAGIKDKDVVGAYISSGVPVMHTLGAFRHQGGTGWEKSAYTLFHNYGLSLADVLSGVVGRFDHGSNLPRFIFVQKELFEHSLVEFMEALKTRGPVKGPEIKALQEAGFNDDEILALL